VRWSVKGIEASESSVPPTTRACAGPTDLVDPSPSVSIDVTVLADLRPRAGLGSERSSPRESSWCRRPEESPTPPPTPLIGIIPHVSTGVHLPPPAPAFSSFVVAETAVGDSLEHVRKLLTRGSIPTVAASSSRQSGREPGEPCRPGHEFVVREDPKSRAAAVPGSISIPKDGQTTTTIGNSLEAEPLPGSVRQ